MLWQCKISDFAKVRTARATAFPAKPEFLLISQLQDSSLRLDRIRHERGQEILPKSSTLRLNKEPQSFGAGIHWYGLHSYWHGWISHQIRSCVWLIRLEVFQGCTEDCCLTSSAQAIMSFMLWIERLFFINLCGHRSQYRIMTAHSTVKMVLVCKNAMHPAWSPINVEKIPSRCICGTFYWTSWSASSSFILRFCFWMTLVSSGKSSVDTCLIHQKALEISSPFFLPVRTAMQKAVHHWSGGLANAGVSGVTALRFEISRRTLSIAPFSSVVSSCQESGRSLPTFVEGCKNVTRRKWRSKVSRSDECRA